jgi:hypothetical protein
VSDGLPCSTCPILDLGTVYPVKDARDPWRRMPKLFLLSVRLFGPSMNSHRSRTRLRLEKLFGHYCKVQRQKYGPCTRARAKVCAGILQDAVSHGLSADSGPERHAFVTHALRTAVNDDRTAERMKDTMVARPTPQLAMPPITFREVPAA